MRRPLLILAVVLTLGFIGLFHWEERPSVLRRAVPSFRLSLEASDDVCSETEQTGILKEAGRHEKGYRLTLECREYSLFVYTELTSEEDEKVDRVTFFMYRVMVLVCAEE